MGNTPTVRQKRLGGEMRRLREAAGVTLDGAAEVLDCSPAKISRVENGYTGVRTVDLRLLMDAYGVDADHRDALVALAKEAKKKDWWQSERNLLAGAYHDYMGLEERATTIQVYQAQLIPGLLQTEAYARAVTWATRTEDTAEEVDRLVRVRMERQAVFQRRTPSVRYRVVLDESALRRPIGEPNVMKDQLHHLMEVSRKRHITLQVLPRQASPHAALEGPFAIFDFADPTTDRPIVYINTLTGGLYLEESPDVGTYKLAFEHLRSSALSMDESRTVLTAVLKELEGDGPEAEHG